jgi:hypothetical protein
MVLAFVPIALFALAVYVSVTRNNDTVGTVGRESTRGIAVAQASKLDLAELDEIVLLELLEPSELASGGFPEEYNTKRRDLHDNLVVAAAEAASGVAHQRSLVNIDHALAHYHALVQGAFEASVAEEPDPALVAAWYTPAHEVMEGTLLPQAEALDKANSYVLNTSYEGHKADASSAQAMIVWSWLALLAFLVVVQVLLARRFRRILNIPVLAATILAVVSGMLVMARLDHSRSNLTKAREEAFDSVHVLARARANAVTARQAQGQRLLDPSMTGTEAESLFRAQADKLFRVRAEDDVIETAQAGYLDEGAGGYLATVARADESNGRIRGGARHSLLQSFGAFLEEDDDLRDLVDVADLAGAQTMYSRPAAFTALIEEIDQAQAERQRQFDRYARAAGRATDDLQLITLVLVSGMAVLVVFGLGQRLKEYT